jgi:Zn-finger nucleic acid-binding protein
MFGMTTQTLCPVCQSNLEAKTVADASVDVCPRCGGVFFDQDELAAAKRSGLAKLDAEIECREKVEEPKGPKLCPKCRVGMDAYRYQYTSNIVLDTCPDCGGVWVDDGELSRMEEFGTQTPDWVAEKKAVAVSELDRMTEQNQVYAHRINRIFRMLSTRAWRT